MRCCNCQEPLNFVPVEAGIPPSFAFYTVECQNSNCFIDVATRFWGYADKNKFIDDYELTFIIDNVQYIVDASLEDNSTTIYYYKDKNTQKEAVRLGKFIPYLDDNDYYTKLVTKVFKLKAFL